VGADLLRDFFLTSVFFFIGIVVRYFLIVGALWWLCYVKKAVHWKARRTQDVALSSAQFLSEIKWSLGTSALFALMGAVLFLHWRVGGTSLYLEWSKYGPLYPFLSLCILLVVHDAYFYWVHRLMHRPRFFRRIHRVHHQYRSPSPWAAFSFHPWEACIEAAIFPVLLYLVPMHVGVLAFWLIFMTVTSVFNHLGYELYPRWVWTQMIGATHHDLHHREVAGNYGLYFTWWDKWLGTQSATFEKLRDKALNPTRESRSKVK
jgi:Delta7-sterol 5-desaturase